jgi:hypothetical protein
MDHHQIKKALLQACSTHINERIATIQQRLVGIEEARNNETKSSAGDKFETGRAMMQMEEEKSKAQLLEATRVRNQLEQIKLDNANQQIGPGHLVKTSNGYYFLAIGIGKVKLDGQTYYCISIQSPIGQLLRARQAGDIVSFNGREIRVEAVL